MQANSTLKKLALLLLVVSVVLTLGCTGKEDAGSTNATTAQALQPTASETQATQGSQSGSSDIQSAGVSATPIPQISPESGSDSGITAANESTPEMDLPLPPDLSDL